MERHDGAFTTTHVNLPEGIQSEEVREEVVEEVMEAVVKDAAEETRVCVVGEAVEEDTQIT